MPVIIVCQILSIMLSYAALTTGALALLFPAGLFLALGILCLILNSTE